MLLSFHYVAYVCSCFSGCSDWPIVGREFNEVGSWLEKNNWLYDEGAIRNLSLKRKSSRLL